MTTLAPGAPVRTTGKWSDKYGMRLSGTVDVVRKWRAPISGRSVRLNLDAPYKGVHQVWLRPSDLEEVGRMKDVEWL